MSKEISKKSITMWIVGVLFIIIGLAMFQSDSMTGIISLILGVGLLPPATRFLKKAFNKMNGESIPSMAGKRDETSEHISQSQEPGKTDSQPAPDPSVCPKCGSKEVFISKRGFKADDACCGFFLCGPLGFLFGAQGANKIQRTCLKCNKTW